MKKSVAVPLFIVFTALLLVVNNAQNASCGVRQLLFETILFFYVHSVAKK